MGKWKFRSNFGQGGQVLEPISMNWPHQPKKMDNRKKEVWKRDLRFSSPILWTLPHHLIVENLVFHIKFWDSIFFIFLFFKCRRSHYLCVHCSNLCSTKKEIYKKFLKNCLCNSNSLLPPWSQSTFEYATHFSYIEVSNMMCIEMCSINFLDNRLIVKVQCE